MSTEICREVGADDPAGSRTCVHLPAALHGTAYVDRENALRRARRSDGATRILGKGGPKRYPLEALAAAVGATNDADVTTGVVGRRVQMAVQLKTTPRTIDRINAAGGLSEIQADRYAVRAGLHPGEVWPQWWDVAPS